MKILLTYYFNTYSSVKYQHVWLKAMTREDFYDNFKKLKSFGNILGK